MSITELNASIAFDRYRAAFEEDRLVQGKWHTKGDDGRQLACALGSLDPAINGRSDCPASVMPQWLARMVPWFFDSQATEDAKAWGLAFYAELKRLDGKVPFSVVYDWHANYTTVLAIEVSEKRNRLTEPHAKLQELHKRALAGDRAPRDQWRAILAYAYAAAYAYAYADAYAYAYADADAYAYADADADADADAYAYAYADADAYAYADADADAVRQERVKRLADGMIECLKRVSA